MTKIAILGAGNGGYASAVDLTLAGFNVTLCSAYNPQHLRPILDKGGIESLSEYCRSLKVLGENSNMPVTNHKNLYMFDR